MSIFLQKNPYTLRSTEELSLQVATHIQDLQRQGFIPGMPLSGYGFVQIQNLDPLSPDFECLLLQLAKNLDAIEESGAASMKSYPTVIHPGYEKAIA